MAIHFHPGDGRRQWPEQGLAPPKTERQKREYDKLYMGVPDVPTPRQARAVISADDLRLRQADAHAELNTRYQLYYTPHRDGRPGGVVRPVQAAAPAPSALGSLMEKHGVPVVHRLGESIGLEMGPAASPLEREAASIEEAAHAIQAVTIGWGVSELYINKTRSGQCSLEHASLTGKDWREKLIRTMSIYLAGKIAQKIKYGRAEITGHSSDDAVVKRLLIVAGDERAEVLAEAERYTEASLRSRWSEVERVAAALRERGQLSGEEFRALLGEPATQVRREMLPMMTRSATLQAAGNDEFDVVFSTGATVRRRDAYNEAYDEQLLMGASNVDMSRLASGKAPFLASHDASNLSSVIGVVTSAKLENGIGLARVRLSNRDDVKGIAQDVRDKILHQVSVGYAVLTAERVQRAGDVPLLRVTRWRPAEVSLVALGADPMASIRSDAPKFEAVVRVQ